MSLKKSLSVLCAVIRKENHMAKGKYQRWLEPEGLLLIEGWAKDGLIDEQIAHNMGINVSTLYEWKKKYNEITEALKKGKEVVDRAVENALLKRALGYDIEEVTTEYNFAMEKEIVTKRVKKHIAPDTTAMIYWLNNRKPEVWRNKQEVNANVNANVRIEDYLKENGKLDF